MQESLRKEKNGQSSKKGLQRDEKQIWKKAPLLGDLSENDLAQGFFGDFETNWECLKSHVLNSSDMNFPTRQLFLTSMVKSLEENLDKEESGNKSQIFERGVALLAVSWIHNSQILDEHGEHIPLSMPDDFTCMAAGFTKSLYNAYDELKPEIEFRTRLALSNLPMKEPYSFSMICNWRFSPFDFDGMEKPGVFDSIHDLNVIRFNLANELNLDYSNKYDGDPFRFTRRGAVIALAMNSYAGAVAISDLKETCIERRGESEKYEFWNQKGLDPKDPNGLCLKGGDPFGQNLLNRSFLESRRFAYP